MGNANHTTVNILCIKWGKKYGSHYVRRLYHGVLRHLSRPFRFVCLTDDPTGLEPPIETYPLPVTPFDEAAFDAKKGGDTWRKVGLFQPGLAGLVGETLFLDLDLVIIDSLDDFFHYEPGRFCVIQDWLEKRRARLNPKRHGRVGNTSVFRFDPQQHSHIYRHFAENEYWALKNFRIEQQYVSYVFRDELAFWPSRWVPSFKRKCRPVFPLNHFLTPRRPADMRILVFHGHPHPDEAIKGYKAGLFKSCRPAPWLEEHWIAPPADEPAKRRISA